MLEALSAGRRRIHSVVLERGRDDGPLADIEAAARAAGAEVHRVDAADLAVMARTEAPQGVIARGDPIRIHDLEDLVHPPPALVLVLDGITDPRNVGAAARSADAAGATGIVLSRHGGSPLTPAAGKAAAGALEHLRVAVVAGIPAALERLRRLGLWVVALDAAGPTDLWGLGLATEPLALVVGGEHRGVGRLVREAADQVVRIPIAGHVGSLNAATAAAVALLEIRRARAGAHGPDGPLG